MIDVFNFMRGICFLAGDPIKELEFNTVSEVISMDLTDVDVSAVKQFSI